MTRPASEGQPGIWLAIAGLGATGEVAADAERRGGVALVGNHSVRLTEGGRRRNRTAT